MNTSGYPPMNGQVNGPMNSQAIPSPIARNASLREAPVRPGQVIRYLIGLLAAWTATIFACRDVVNAPQSGAQPGNVIALALATLGGVMVLFWIVLTARKLSRKALPLPLPQPQVQQLPGQPAGGHDPNFPPPYPRGAAPAMPLPPRGAPAPGRPAGPNGEPAPDQDDSSKVPTVASYQGSQFLNDPLFTLEDPSPARLFQTQKDKNNLNQDSFACNSQRGIYVVTDGVTGSLMSAPWARIVAREYVTYMTHLGDPFQQDREDVFRIWLSSCMHQWRDWMYNTRASLLGSAGGSTVKTATVAWEKSIDYWHERVNSKPAQSTAVTCSIQRDGHDRIILHVNAIGDAECLVFRPDRHEALELRAAFPLDKVKQFNDHPDTLTTDTTDAVAHVMFKNIRRADIEVKRGDIAILATDSVAQWVLRMATSQVTPQQMQPPAPNLQDVFRFTSQDDFARFVEQECDAGRLERDDETLLIIPIS